MIDPVTKITAFLEDAISEMYKDHVTVQALVPDQEMGPAPTDYRLDFRGHCIKLTDGRVAIDIDGTVLDTEPWVEDLYHRFHGACIERQIFQEHEAQMRRRVNDKARQASSRFKEYWDLAAKL